ncbi:hypothetical protein B0H12DRAFT_593054 [Mycena haematopus]|nr:hypothetical protein B0H12DRAFT_593054 [Mycena haematopus]
MTANPKTLKRAFGSENHDESSAEIDLRPLKRARTQAILSPQFVIQTSAARIQSPAIAIFPTRAAPTNIFYPSPANSSPLKTLNKPAPRAPKSLRRIDFSALKPTPSMSVPSFPRLRFAGRHHSAANPNPNLINNTENIPRSKFIANDPIFNAPAAHYIKSAVPETYENKILVCCKMF